VARGDSVVVLDDLSTGRSENLEAAMAAGEVELVEGSVVDEGLVEECLAGVDGCVHLASAVGVKLILDRPLESLLNNVRGADVVVGAAARSGRRLLFASTSEIYGKDCGSALSESSDRSLGPPSTLRWSYSTAKAFGESLIHAYRREGRCNAVIVRPFNTVGPRQVGAYGMVLPRFLRQALDGKPLTVYGDGSQSRCFTHVYDAVEALLALLDSDVAEGGTYNIGSPIEVPIIELARRVIDRTGSSSRIEFVPYGVAYGGDFEELGRRKPDITAIRDAVQWEPRRSLTDMIDDTMAYERERLGASTNTAASTA